MYQDLGNTCFGFINPIESLEKTDFKTLNNDVILNALKNKFNIIAQASGRNDLTVHHDGVDKKISGSAYKLKLGNPKS